MSARSLTACSTLAALLLAGVLSQALAKPPDAPRDEVQVVLEVRFLSVSDSLAERLGVDLGIRNPQPETPENAVTPKLTFLNDRQVFQFLEAAQCDCRTKIMQAPKMMVLNGQAATLSTTDQQFFVTGVKVTWTGEDILCIPQNEAFTTGLKMSVQPVVSPDQRLVHLDLRADLTNLDPATVPLSPVTAMITPRLEGGAEGKPVPFTQFIQTPKFTRLSVDKTLSIPDGRTVLLSGWKTERQVRHESGPPLLSQIPYLNRLFKKAGHGRETDHLLMMITPRILIEEAEETCQEACACPCPRPMPAARTSATALAAVEEQEAPGCRKANAQKPDDSGVRGKDKVVAKLVEEYHRACAEGRLAEAKSLADAALILDPACFSKGRGTMGAKQR